MRILYGPVAPEHWDYVQKNYARPGDEIICYAPETLAYAEIRQSCPHDWQPDVLLHWSPEYNPVPKGLEEADCLTVGAFGDWNLGARAIQNIGGAFDVLFADRSGSALLRNVGFTNVHYARLWGYNPTLHRRLPDVERDIDILMIGNLNHSVQRERSFWLARVARLSRRHRVVLTNGLQGEAYVRMMNRAKIVFNKSVGGGINMRAYEATVCGALLFNERENEEIGDIFTDREHCVLYGDNDLETLLDHYLAPENAAERERIAQAGWERVQPYDDVNRTLTLLDKIEPMATEWREYPEKRVPRSYASLSPTERQMRRLYQWHTCNQGTLFTAMNEEWGAIRAAFSDEETEAAAEAANAHGALIGEWAAHLPVAAQEPPLRDAQTLWQTALSLEPDYIVPRVNRGALYYTLGQTQNAVTELNEALRLLEAPDVAARQLRGLVFPLRYERFDMEVECVWSRLAPGTDAWGEAMRTLYRGHVYAMLADLALCNGDYAETVRRAEQATNCIPAWGEALCLLARSYRAQGRIKEAGDAYFQAISAAPFLFSASQDAAQLLIEQGRAADAAALLEDLTAILDGCPFYAPVRPPIDQLLAQAKLRARQQTPAERPVRLLAMPDWNAPEQWQSLLRNYVQTYQQGDPILLLLPVIAEQHPQAETVMQAVAQFFDTELRAPSETIPDVVLMTEPLESVLLVEGKPLADAVVLVSGREETEIARRAGIPTLAQENLKAARTLLSAA